MDDLKINAYKLNQSGQNSKWKIFVLLLVFMINIKFFRYISDKCFGVGFEMY